MVNVAAATSPIVAPFDDAPLGASKESDPTTETLMEAAEKLKRDDVEGR